MNKIRYLLSKLNLPICLIGFVCAFVSNETLAGIPVVEEIDHPTEVMAFQCVDDDLSDMLADPFVQNIGECESGNFDSEMTDECLEGTITECIVNIDFIYVSDCLDDLGSVDVAIGGSTNRSVVTVELMVDGILYFFDSGINGSLWISNFEIQGTSISYFAVHAGNSETGCTIYDYQVVQLPTTSCNGGELNMLEFHDGSTPFCNPPSAEVKMYQSGTTTLKHILTAEFDESLQSYLIENPPQGTFDVFIKPSGCLQQGFPTVIITLGTNALGLDALQKGDLNNTNSINIADVSILSGAFNSSVGSSNYVLLGDFNCSGSINISDISIFGVNFNAVGDNPPFFEP